MKYKLATSSWDDKEIKAINDVIISNKYSMGSMVRKFEQDFAEFFNSKFAVMTSSGSTANLISIASLFFTKNPKLKRGDEVIVPAVSWSTTYFPLQQYGLKLKFVDIDLESLNYNLTDLEDAISSKTKMIMVVNLLGNPNDFEKINTIIEGKNIFLIEDNCESMGATFNGKFTGTFGLLGTFSSFFSHHIATMEGGMILTDDEELYHILLCLRAHGWTRNLPKINHVNNKSDDEFYESFNFILPGYNVRPLEMSGAIGSEQLKKLPNFLNQRKKNASLFNDLFSKNKNILIQKEIGVSSWFGFSIIMKNNSKISREDMIRCLTEAGVETRPIVTGDFTKNSVLRFFEYELHGEMKNAQFLDKNGFFVGNSHEDLSNEINYLHKILNEKF